MRVTEIIDQLPRYQQLRFFLRLCRSYRKDRVLREYNIPVAVPYDDQAPYQNYAPSLEKQSQRYVNPLLCQRLRVKGIYDRTERGGIIHDVVRVTFSHPHTNILLHYQDQLAMPTALLLMAHGISKLPPLDEPNYQSRSLAWYNVIEGLDRYPDLIVEVRKMMEAHYVRLIKDVLMNYLICAAPRGLYLSSFDNFVKEQIAERLPFVPYTVTNIGIVVAIEGATPVEVNEQGEPTYGGKYLFKEAYDYLSVYRTKRKLQALLD